MLETLDYTIRIGSTPTFLYFDLYLHWSIRKSKTNGYETGVDMINMTGNINDKLQKREHDKNKRESGLEALK